MSEKLRRVLLAFAGFSPFALLVGSWLFYAPIVRHAPIFIASVGASIFGIYAFVLLDLRGRRVSNESRVRWIIFLLIAGALALPMYWYSFVIRGKDEGIYRILA
jgi:hypothetical protein